DRNRAASLARRRKNMLRCSLALAMVLAFVSPGHSADAITADEVAALQREGDALRTKLQPLRPKPDLLADADTFLKGITWALRYDKNLQPADVALIKKALGRAKERAEALAADKKPWTAKKGRVVRGYVSFIDGSTQPFGLVIPAKYDPEKPIRLDV